MRLYMMLMLTLILGLCSIWAAGENAGTVPTPTPTNVGESSRSVPTPAPIEVQVSMPFKLERHQQAVLENDNIDIVFDEVLEDSRCPATAECITAGSVHVQVSINGQPYTLTLGDIMRGDTSSIQLENGLILELLKVNPYPGSQEDTPDADASISLVVSK